MIKKLYDGLYRGIMFVCKLLLIADVVVTSYAVLGRYIGKYIPLFKDPAWSEEIVLTCMIYMAFLSASLAIRKQTHIRMTSFDQILPKKAVAVLQLFGDVLVTAFACVMWYEGGKFAMLMSTRGYYVSIPWLSKMWLYLPVPMAGIAITLFELEILVKDVKALSKGGDEKNV